MAKFNQNSLIFKNSKIQFSKFLKTKILSKTKKTKFPKNPKSIKKHSKINSKKIKIHSKNSYYRFLIGFTGNGCHGNLNANPDQNFGQSGDDCVSDSCCDHDMAASSVITIL